MSLGSFLRNLSYRFFPGSCLLCGFASHRRMDLCPDCEADLPWLHRAPGLCRYCAEPLPGGTELCGACIRRRPVFDGAHCGFLYAFPINRMLSRYKHEGRQLEGELLHELMRRQVLRALPRQSPPAWLLPVPLHEHSRRQRGFDQAVMLAGHLGANCGLRVETGLLKRVRRTRSQQQLSRKERRRNLAGAFVANAAVLQAGLAAGYTQLVLIDDVLTTGSTCNAAARALRRAAGGRRLHIEVWCLARTPSSA